MRNSFTLSLFDQPVMDLFDAAPELMPPAPPPITDPAPVVLRIPEPPRDAARTDVHRPSAIDPADYEFVAHECLKIYPGDVGMIQFLIAERERIREHMARTGGNYSSHQHGGNCMVCGSVNAVYTVLFYHEKSNTYVRMGADCTEKCYNGQDFGAARFRSSCDDVRQALAGKRKAEALLGDWGLSLAWELYTADYKTSYQAWGKDEITARDIVGNLVKYGSLSDKQQGFLSLLVKRIVNKPVYAARRAQEAASAADCPTGRVVIVGRVLSMRDQFTDYGEVTKMLVKHESGFKVWATCPGSLDCQKGDTIQFTATVEPSRDDPKFGFGKRPTKAEVINRAQQEAPTE